MARRPNILVVDDDAASRRLLEVALGLRGFAVQLATNGQEALDLIEAGYRPDVVLLDFLMPVLDGHGFYQALQLLPVAKGITVIGLTVDDDAAAAFETIVKPVNLDHLVARLRLLTAPAPAAPPTMAMATTFPSAEMHARRRRFWRRMKILVPLLAALAGLARVFLGR